MGLDDPQAGAILASAGAIVLGVSTFLWQRWTAARAEGNVAAQRARSEAEAIERVHERHIESLEALVAHWKARALDCEAARRDTRWPGT